MVLAEAAAWIARLQGSARTAAAEAAFKEWLAADSAHAHAFSRATDTWEVIPGAARLVGSAGRGSDKQRDDLQARWLAVAATLAIAIVGAVLYAQRSPTYLTGVGQQQTVTLDDGTRVSLNTDSKLTVLYTEDERRLRLDRGEGLFEVARDPLRPLIVEAGREQVRALGTKFVVRKDAMSVAVTLLDGKIEMIRPSNSGGAAASAGRKVLLEPGERVIARDDEPVVHDRPKVEALIAWRRGEVMFDDASLQDVAAEINRYGSSQRIIVDSSVAHLRVSGVFETRDPREFAQAMARLHRLQVRDADGRIVLHAPQAH